MKENDSTIPEEQYQALKWFFEITREAQDV